MKLPTKQEMGCCQFVSKGAIFLISSQTSTPLDYDNFLNQVAVLVCRKGAFPP